MNEEKCILCQAYDVMTHLIAEGVDFKDSFHTVVEDLLTDTHEESFEEGYVTALAHIHNYTAKSISEIINHECDCDECECNGSCN